MRHRSMVAPWAQGLSLLIVLLVTLALLPTTSVQAASSVTVKTSEGDKTEDNGACSLREALQALFVPSNDDCGTLSAPLTITFDAPGMIQLKGGVLPSITKIVTITGPVIIDGSDGIGGNSNIFIISSDGILNLANLTLTKGARAITVNNGVLNAAGTSFIDNVQDGTGGGAILNSGGTVNVAGSLFTANKAPNGSGGAINSGGSGDLNVAGSIFSGNTAKINGGAISAGSNTVLTDLIFNGNIATGDDDDSDGQDAGGGALFFNGNAESDQALTVTRGIFNGNLSPEGDGGALFLNIDAEVTVRDSAFNGNLAGIPGTDRTGGAIFSTAVLTLTNSTLLNNGVVGDGGAIANDRSGELTLSNSTLIANAASGRGGAIVTNNTQQGSTIRPRSTLLNVTLALNAGVDGGALFSQAPNSSYPQVTLLGNTIIADSVSANCSGGAYSSLGHNLDSGNSCGLSGSGDLTNANANLDAPGFNGGPLDLLLTMKLKPGSAALDAGDPQICADAPVNGEDQTGRARPQDGDGVGGSGCDIGALENEAAVAGFGSTPVNPGPIPFGNTTVNTSIDAGFSVFNTGNGPLNISSGSLTGSNVDDFSLQTNFPLTINPGGAAQAIDLRCTPSAAGPRTAALTLSTNAPGNASVIFNLLCNGTPVPTAGFASQPITPGPISIGKVRVGETASLPLQISESGTAQLQVTNIAIGGLNPDDFKLDSTADITIANGGAAVTRTVSCTPTALGPRSATLTMATNDPLQPDVSFNLSCSGNPPPQLVFETGGTSVATANGPYGISLSPDGNHLYVGNDTAGVLHRFDRNAAGYPADVLSYADGLSGGDFLGGVRLSTVSADGRFVYAAATNDTVEPKDNAINVFSRSLEDGSLIYQETVKQGDQYGFLCPAPCTFPTISGLGGAYEPVLSPDGKYLYVSGITSDSITVLLRNPDTGSLRNIFNRAAVVQEVIDATNLNGAYGMAMSSDGKFLYATGYISDSLVVFSRDPNNGRLTALNGGVYKAPDIAGLNGVFRVTISPDGNFLYTASYDGDALTAFKRNPATGLLTLVETYTDGQDGITDLNAASSVAVSPDGNYLFATAFNSAAVSIFARDKQTGELAQLQTIVRDANSGQPALGGARDVKVSPDGRMIFVTGRSDNRVTGFGLANPVPLLRSLDPASAVAGSPELTLTVNGESFVEGAVVTWDGQNLPTTFVNAGELRATVAASRLQAAGSATIGVTNPPPLGGPSSNTLSFTITAPNENPVPSLTRIAPGGATAGDLDLTITVYGGGFLASSQALWNGAERPTSYISDSALEMQVSTADLAQPGTAVITVRNPAPGGGLSNNLPFEIAGPGENPTPAIRTIAPGFATAGATSSEVIVTLNGAGFMPESQARWNGANRPTSYIDPETLEVSIGAADLLEAGNGSIDVINPEPGGGGSNVVTFVIGESGDQPIPSVNGVSFGAVTGGSIAVTVRGSNFVDGAKVRWNGQEYTPSAVTTSAITFALPAGAYRSAVVEVVNPGPGGGPSNEFILGLLRMVIPYLAR